MNTTPMATISKAEVERLKYELAMALRSEKRLLEENEANLIVLKANYGAIESLPIDALGEVGPTHEHNGYPIRDEVLHEIAARIKATEVAIRKAKGHDK